MNVEMWNHPAVKANVAILKSRGHLFVNPEPGKLACGMQGEGRLASVDVIVAQILEALNLNQSMSGLKVLVTAGPTVEDIDPIRFLSNRSSGKMGYAVAQAAIQRGAEVFLVSGPTELQAPSGVHVIPVRSAAQMKEKVLELFPGMDIVVKAAAVADYRPVEISSQKIKKGAGELTLRLTRTDDILDLLGKQKNRQILVGFAAETEKLLESARDKLIRKNLDLLVANDVTSGVFGSDTSTAHILTMDGSDILLQDQSKLAIAGKLLDAAHALLVSPLRIKKTPEGA
jgi:phosphopantothenoylcysteine decarboxylase/phosphopantothenate--cysteine ligase